MQSTDHTEISRRLVARLRFRQLELLVLLRKDGSLRAAAAELNLTQPALSKTLREIESAFGFDLFVRGARGLTATRRGEAVIHGAELLLQQLAHLGRETASEPALTMVRLGAPPFAAQGIVPEVLARLMAQAGPLQVQLQEERVPRLIEALQAGHLDAVISSYPPGLQAQAGAAQRSLRYEKLFDAAFCVIAAPGHPLARARRVSWERLAGADWIMPTAGSMVRRLIDDSFMRQGIVPPSPVIESTSPYTNLRMVAAGLGLSAVPEMSLRDVPASLPFKRVRTDPPLAPAPVALIHRGAPENPRVGLLRAALGLPRPDSRSPKS